MIIHLCSIILCALALIVCSSNVDERTSMFNDDGGDFCYKKEECDNDLHSFATNELNGMKYLLYDVSREQSASRKLRIYINVARTVQKLKTNWTLVLPPWDLFVSKWKDYNESKNKIKWSDFFKIEMLQELIPVIEFDQFVEHVSNELDLVLVLNRFEQLYDVDVPEIDLQDDEPAKNRTNYELSDQNCRHISFYEQENHIEGLFFGFKNYVKAKKMLCMSVNGDNDLLVNAFRNELAQMNTIFIQNMELIKSSPEQDHVYWLFRRSLRIADSVIHRANKFRRKYFDSDDEKDKTFLTSDWQLAKLNKQKQSDQPIGGHYLAVHWSARGDSMKNIIDSEDDTSMQSIAIDDGSELKVQEIVKQIFIALKANQLTWTFVTTSNIDETKWTELVQAFKLQLEAENKSPDRYKLFRYKNKSNKMSPLELELIEKWICAHARFFIGTSDSMYTRFVQEEREILGFEPLTTFNLFCQNSHRSFDTQTDLCKVDKPQRIKY